MMKIIKYKKGSKGLYKVELDDGRCLALYEEVILKFNLLLTKEVLESDLEDIEKYNLECDVYYVALNSLKSRFKSVYDTKEYLLRKEYPNDLVEMAVDKLVSQGYLNDRSYAKGFINNKMVTSNMGPNKIRKELLEHKISLDIINEELVVFEEELQLEKINKVVDKLIRSNHTRGGFVLKKKITNDLVMLGYDIDLINRVISDYDFSNDKDMVKKEYDKLYKRLSRKYSGNELEYKIKEKLYQKGLYYEE